MDSATAHRYIRMMRSLVCLIVTLLVTSASAQPFNCGTGPENDERLQRLERWAAGQEHSRLSKGRAAESQLAVRDSVVLLDADDLTAPFLRPFDLNNRSLVFTPLGGSRYSVENVPLVFEENRGLPVAFLGSPALWTPKFPIPFFGRTISRFYISQLNALYPDDPLPNATYRQYSDLELAAHREAVIAPLLMTSPSLASGSPLVHARETDDFVVITWTLTATIDYTVQATLFRDGRIRFSYRDVKNIYAGGVVLTPGSLGWRGERSLLADAADAEADVSSSAPAAVAPMADVTSVFLDRIGDSNLLELLVRVRAPIDRTQIPASQPLVFTVDFGERSLGQRFTLQIPNVGAEVYVRPDLGSAARSPAATVNGDTISISVLQDFLTLSSPVRINVTTGPTSATFDEAQLTAVLGGFGRGVRRDFSSPSPAEFEGAVVEAFTLPILNTGRVWTRLRGAYMLNPAEIDAVAIYQNFGTDIQFYAGAYATRGNSGDVGISPFISSVIPRSPTLLHMNRLAFGPNRTDRSASHVVMHELGHRWLLFIRIMENGMATTSLNPLSAHPAQYVDTRAAFSVYSGVDSSVMGGGTFTENANGTFTSSAYGAYGYSWLDLYLMGLAQPSEVEPWFYIANSSPELGGAYYPPANATVGGTRKDVNVQQVVDTMGIRKPMYPDAQKRFRVLFVLLTNPQRPATPEEVATITSYRRLLETNFQTATGGRGEVTTDFTPSTVPRRRAAR